PRPERSGVAQALLRLAGSGAEMARLLDAAKERFGAARHGAHATSIYARAPGGKMRSLVPRGGAAALSFPILPSFAARTAPAHAPAPPTPSAPAQPAA